MITYLVIGGIVLLGIEAVVPGTCVFGVAGMIALLAALYLFLGAGAMASIVVAFVAVISLIIGIVLIREVPNSWIGRRLTLSLESTKDRGYSGNDERVDLLGQEGVTQSVLRPAGRALFGENIIDVITDGEFYEPGTKVVVVAVTGGRVVVRKVESEVK
ncbi:MAG: hypothetical protein E7204_02240 [Veillonella sp.]|uniref:NfeD family protein n=1 Tax=Veillonella TaxID=29465 RepID=UPI000F8EF516|nr:MULTISPECIES: NfeD family protein [Veillonella]MBE6079655.1 hypothetical protein [Veillonella sp.]